MTLKSLATAVKCRNPNVTQNFCEHYLPVRINHMFLLSNTGGCETAILPFAPQNYVFINVKKYIIFTHSCILTSYIKTGSK